MSEEIIVSIHCTVYNHGMYLRDCLNGFVMQKTNFKFEAIVHDDASTDNSSQIILEYAEKYPDIIKPILEKENQYSKHDGSLIKIMNEACTGKFIAFCEGDDYWVDPHKLQTQVDYLEAHPEVGMCYTNYNQLIEKKHNKSLVTNMFTNDNPKKYDITLGDLIRDGVYIAPMTWLIRNNLWKSIPDIRNIVDGTLIYLAYFKKVSITACLLENSTAVYRIHDNSATQTISAKRNYKRIKGLYKEQMLLADMFLDTDCEFSKKYIEKKYYTYTTRWVILYGNNEEQEKLKAYYKNLAPKYKFFVKYSKCSIVYRLFKWLIIKSLENEGFIFD